LQLYRGLSPGASSPVDPRSATVPWRLLGLGRAGRWFLLGSALGLVFFLTVPRQTDLVWDAGKLASAKPRAIRTGLSGEIDLNRRGSVEVNEEPAFTVTVRDSQGRPKLDLPADQRWRAMTVDVYHHGRWSIVLPDWMLDERGQLRDTVPPGR